MRKALDGLPQGVKRSVAALLEHLISAQQCRVRHIDADDGKPFNPLTIPPPDISAPPRDRSVGGVGIYFVAQLMDDVAYERQGDTNYLILSKKINN